jgi:hypothetical protein
MKNINKVLLLTGIIFCFSAQSLKGQDDILFRRHVISSGINGFFYGLALDYIAGVSAESGAAYGIPIVSAGTAALIPILSNPEKTISANSMVLATHGKLIGWAHGFAFSTLLLGENAWDSEDGNTKFTIGLGALTSIGLGIAGYKLGENKPWSEGQVALYRHYGWLGPLTGLSIVSSFSDEPRLYGASVLLFGAGGYLIADKVYKWNEFTRGDVRAVQVLSILNGGLGLGIAAQVAENDNSSRAVILIPALGAISGTVLGQMWLKNAALSPKQGLNTAYAATGGAVFGLGIALITESESATPYYLIPYLTGLTAYTIAVEKMIKKNKIQGFVPEKRKNNWNVAFMPQNIFLNTKISAKGYQQPLLAASLTF